MLIFAKNKNRTLRMPFSYDDEYYFDATGKHYNSKRSLAAAYLQTVGSKALVVTDSLLKEDTALLSMLEALDEESDIKRDIMFNEEALRSYKKLNHSLTSQSGVLLFKRGRNGKTRRIRLKLMSSNSEGDCLVWKSSLLVEKRFHLNSLTQVFIVNDELDIDDNQPSLVVDEKNSRSSIQDQKTNALSNIRSSPTSLPTYSTMNGHFIRLTNELRDLDIQFHSAAESQACVRFLSSYIVKK